MNWLQGKKTYLLGVAIIVVSILKYKGIIDETAYQLFMGVLFPGQLMALRSAKK